VLTKEAFVGVDYDAMGGETIKNWLSILEMLLGGGTSDEYIINIGVRWGNTTEDLIHKLLESLCSVPETEGHLHKLKQSKGGANGWAQIGGSRN
jgi:hypothetical protein